MVKASTAKSISEISDILSSNYKTQSNKNKANKKPSKKATKNNDNASNDSEKFEVMDIKNAVKTLKERSMLKSANKYFYKQSKERIELLVKLINMEHNVSHRTIEDFCKKLLYMMPDKYRNKKAKLHIDINTGERNTIDHQAEYNARWSALGTKKYFDVFKRGSKFKWNYDTTDKSKTVVTALCQLNMFKFLFEYNIIDFIIKNHDTILKKLKKNKKKKSNKSTKSVDSVKSGKSSKSAKSSKSGKNTKNTKNTKTTKDTKNTKTTKTTKTTKNTKVTAKSNVDSTNISTKTDVNTKKCNDDSKSSVKSSSKTQKTTKKKHRVKNGKMVIKIG